jgi:hypothetical protein
VVGPPSKRLVLNVRPISSPKAPRALPDITGAQSKLLAAPPNTRMSNRLRRDECAPVHSITSSARASREGGIVMPSAFAVLRLITNSYLVGACTGSSAGFSPLRTRST